MKQSSKGEGWKTSPWDQSIFRFFPTFSPVVFGGRISSRGGAAALILGWRVTQLRGLQELGRGKLKAIQEAIRDE